MEGAREPARRGRPGYDQATVLRRSVDLFNAQGYDATSIADLAAHLGLTKSAIYHHVPSKEALLEAALDEALDALSDALDRASEPAQDDTAQDRLRIAVSESVLILVERLPAVTLLLRVRGNSAVEQAALSRRREINDKLTALVRAAAADGQIRTDLSPEMISRLLFGMINSTVEWYRPDGTTSAEELAQAITTVTFDGLIQQRG